MPTLRPLDALALRLLVLRIRVLRQGRDLARLRERVRSVAQPTQGKLNRP
jgi:hypothetical protein